MIDGGGSATLTLASTSGTTSTFSGVIADGAGRISLVVACSGTQVLSGASTYTGGTTLAGGVLDFAAGSLPFDTTVPDITFAGGTLQWAAGNSDDVSAGIAPIAAGQTAILDTNGNNVTLSSVLSGDGGLNKLGAGTLTLDAANTFSGVMTIEAGTLMLANSQALQDSTFDTDGGGTLELVPGIGSVYLGGLSGATDTVLEDGAANPAPIQLFVGGNSQDTVYSGMLSGGGSLTKIGSGTLTLDGLNTYTGGTEIAGGVLQLGIDGALPTNLPLQIGDPNLSYGVLDLNGHNLTLPSLFTGAPSATHGTVWDEVTNTSSTLVTLTVDDAGDCDYEGFLSGNLALAKYGTGTLTVGGTCVNTGDVAVYDGTLNVTGGFTSIPYTVPGYGNPQLAGNVDPVYFLITGGPAHGEAGFTLSNYDFSNFHVPTSSTGGVIEDATSWQAAVDLAVSGSVKVYPNGVGNGSYWTITYTGNHPSDGFMVGTLSWLQQHVQPIPGATFDLGESQYGLRSDTQLIVMEDRTNSSPYWNNKDYDDCYWVVTATPLTVNIDTDSNNDGTINSADNQVEDQKPGRYVVTHLSDPTDQSDLTAAVITPFEYYPTQSGQAYGVLTTTGGISVWTEPNGGTELVGQNNSASWDLYNQFSEDVPWTVYVEGNTAGYATLTWSISNTKALPLTRDPMTR